MSTSEMPKELKEYIEKNTRKNGVGGKHLLLKLIAQKRDPFEEIVSIAERHWIKKHGFSKIGRAYKTGYHTIWRIVNDLTPFKDYLIEQVGTVTRRKVYFDRVNETSDYETVRNYIAQAKRDELRSWKGKIVSSRKCWIHLNRKDPANWEAQEVVDYLATLSQGSQSNMLDGIRKVAPHLKPLVRTGRYREKLKRRKKDIFGVEVNMIRKALSDLGMEYHKTILELHMTLGAREGANNPKAGMTGISWDKFKRNFTTMDLFESKVRGGIHWRDCPIDLFFADLPTKIRAMWEERGKPITEKLLRKGYTELRNIYKEIRSALAKYFEGKLEPSLFTEITTLKPHDADKMHVNLLWEAEVPLEVVAGQYLGQGEGVGLMGRGWLSINTIKKYYLSLTQRSQRFKALKKQVSDYSKQFNEGS